MSVTCARFESVLDNLSIICVLGLGFENYNFDRKKQEGGEI